MAGDLETLPRPLRWLPAPRAHLWLSTLALALVSPALVTGLVIDDYVFALLCRASPGIAGFHADPLFLFSFTSGRPADNLALMDQGALLPWWADPQHLNAFFRPLSSLSHALDFRLWPHAPWAMHLHSMLWFLALLLVVAHVYRRLEDGGGGSLVAASLAFALYALDDARGMTVGWIANRNALIAATLALPALGAHHRWRRLGWRPGVFLGPVCFALGLCAGETALGVFGCLLAYALAFDRGPLPRRLLAIAPYVLVVVAWRVVFSALGLGSRGSGAYHDPLREPFGFGLSLLDHLPLLLAAQLGAPIADVVFWGAPEAHLPLWILSAAGVLALAWLCHKLLWADAAARFWALALVLSSAVVAASVPGERLLVVPGVSGAALVARLLVALWRSRPGELRGARVFAAALVLLHLVAAPLLLPLRAYSMGLLGAATAHADRSLPAAPRRPDETWVVLAAPFDLLVSYVQVAREARHEPRPAHFHWLSTASSPVRVVRSGDRSLRVRPEQGFLRSSPERHYRGEPRALSPGSRVALSEMTAVVLSSTSDGRPAEVEFEFRQPLSSPRYRFFRYAGRRGFVELEPPAAGTVLELPREDFFHVLLQQVL